jgi:aromatic-L-amino-acid/L-tryptophan decarboxylase
MQRTNKERPKSRRPERALSLSDPELATAGNLLTDFLRSFETSLDGPRVMPVLDRDQLAELFGTPFPEVGIGVESLFRDIRAKVLPNCTTVAHRRFLAYVMGPPNGIAPFAEAVAAALNQNCNFWQLSPAASVIERKVISWLGSLFGYPHTARGILTSGGSMANLMALSVAMHDKAPADLRNAGLSALASPLVVYASAEAHRSVEKGAAILGLGLNNVRKIPVDSDFQLRVDLLERAIEEDRRAGPTPFCAVATAGTVNTGAIDPIDEIADLCAREGLWFHIDGAYDALFVLTDQMNGNQGPAGFGRPVHQGPGCAIHREYHAGGHLESPCPAQRTGDDHPGRRWRLRRSPRPVCQGRHRCRCSCCPASGRRGQVVRQILERTDGGD